MSEELKQETKQEMALQPITVNEKGELAPTNHVQLKAIALQLIKGGGVPKRFETTEQVIAAWIFASQLGLPPVPAMRNIANIKGTTTGFGELPLCLAQKTGELEECKEFVVDQEYKEICFENKNLGAELFAGVCIIKRKGKEKHSYSFSVQDAKNAGLWGMRSKSGEPLPWSSYPKVMLCRRARAMALKAEFADALMGMAIAEYDYNEFPDFTEKLVSPKQSVLNDRFAE